MKPLNITTLIVVLAIIIVLQETSVARDSVFVWHGNPDLSPIEAVIGELNYIDFYFQTDSDAYVADMSLPLGVQDLYIE